MKKLLTILSLTGLAACSGDPVADTGVDAKTFSYNNFEGGGGWSGNPGQNDASLVAKGQAHSGQYAIFVDANHEFSLTYDQELGKISNGKFKKVHLDAWVFLPSAKATATIGLQLLQPDKTTQVFADDIKLVEAAKKFNTWVEVSKDIVLPDNITAVQHMRVFAWRASSTEKVLVDDVKLSLVE